MPQIYGGLVEQFGNVVVSDVCCLCNSLGSILDKVFYSLFAKDKHITVNNFSKCRSNGNDRLRNGQPHRRHLLGGRTMTTSTYNEIWYIKRVHEDQISTVTRLQVCRFEN